MRAAFVADWVGPSRTISAPMKSPAPRTWPINGLIRPMALRALREDRRRRCRIFHQRCRARSPAAPPKSRSGGHGIAAERVEVARAAGQNRRAVPARATCRRSAGHSPSACRRDQVRRLCRDAESPRLPRRYGQNPAAPRRRRTGRLRLRRLRPPRRRKPGGSERRRRRWRRSCRRCMAAGLMPCAFIVGDGGRRTSSAKRAETCWPCWR